MNVSELYFAEINQIPFHKDQCERTVFRDIAGKERLLLSLLPYIRRYALWMQNKDMSVMDLIGVGNLAICEKLEESLYRPSPAAYLLKTARGNMIEWRRTHGRGPITLPPLVGYHDFWRDWDNAEAFERIDAEVSLRESISEPEDPEITEALEAAISILPSDKARELIMHLFGFAGREERNLSEMAEQQGAYNRARYNKQYYLKNMRKFLVEYYPDLVARYTYSTRAERKSAQAFSQFYGWIKLPTDTRKKLDQTLTRLLAEGATIDTLSVDKLRRTSHTSRIHTKIFLFQQRQQSMQDKGKQS